MTTENESGEGQPSTDEQLAELQKKIDLAAKQQQLLAAERALIEEQTRTLEAEKQAEQAKAASTQIEDWETKTKEAEAQKKALEAQMDIVKAVLPTGESKPIEGKIEGDLGAFGHIAELVANRAAQQVASELGKSIGELELEPEPVKILVVGDRQTAQSDIPLLEIKQQFARYNNLLGRQTKLNADLLGGDGAVSPAAEAIKEKPKEDKEILEVADPATIAAAVAAVPSILGFVGDVAGYFKLDYSIKGETPTLDEEALIAAVIAPLNDKYEVYLADFYQLDGSTIIQDYIDLLAAMQNLEASVARLQVETIEPLKTKLSKVKDGDTQAETIKNSISKAETAAEQSKQLSKEISTFLATITAAEGDEKVSRLVKAALQQKIHDLEITHLLYLSMKSTGAQTVTKASRWRSGEVFFLGGAVLSYVLATQDGRVISADSEVTLARLDYKLSGSSAAQWKIISLTS